MLNFYDVDKEYIKFLKKYEPKVPNVGTYESTNEKFMCGVVLAVNGINYYAPISHMTRPQQTNLIIRDKERAISSIRFSFMFPAIDEVLKVKSIKDERKIDSLYADLLLKEYNYCNANIERIMRKAQNVYKMGTNEEHAMYKNCCNFKLLEKIYMDFKK